MLTASSNRPAAPPSRWPPSRRPLPDFFRAYQQRFGAVVEVSPLSTPAKQRGDVLPNRPWQERLREWLVGPDGRACGVSLLFHGTLLLVLSLMALRSGGGSDRFGVSLQPGDFDSDGLGLENVHGDGIESAAGSVEIETSPSVAAAPSAMQESLRPVVDLDATMAGLEPLSAAAPNATDLLESFDEAGGNGRGRATGSGIGKGIGNLTDGFAKPGSGKAVRKGKFTAWTVPADPKPMQNYLIVIEVAWPKTADRKSIRSRRNDVSGTVQGSDSYLQIIEQSGRFIPKSNQIVVPVPGAEQNVQDVIRVRSSMLNESQELTITF